MATASVSTARAAGYPWWLVLLQGIAALIMGILLITSPGMTTLVLIQIVGWYWLITGILGIVGIFVDSSMWGWKLFLGILGILAGMAVIQHPLWSAILIPTILVIIIAVQGLIAGVIQLIQAFQGGGWGVGLLGVLGIILGIVLLASPLLAATVLPWVLGIFSIVGGIAAIIGSFSLR
jgi:uncharacterized membrane protein HdeD (DUF308 family)